MSKLNVTPGEWSVAHMANDNVSCNCPWVLSEGYFGSIATINWSKDRELENGDNPPLEQAKANAILIADAGTTYNKCGLLSSELMQQNEELKEALKEAMQLLDGEFQKFKEWDCTKRWTEILTKHSKQ